MTDYQGMESLFRRTLGMHSRPVAIAFRSAAPAGVEKFSGVEPSSCSYWRLAAAGRSFYTVPSDHFNCAIGSYTHNIPLPQERAPELEQTLKLMTGIGYLKMEEVPGIPRLAETPGVVIYAPLGETPVDPDLVLLTGRPGKTMLLQEAALRAGVRAGLPLLGRPTCMALPAALAGGLVLSAGCIGNRVYTNVGEDELYAVVAGKDLRKIAAELETIASANATLFDFHRARRAELATE
ncbi:MAG: DUF169 domain-containing protein [Acidobacteriota bacterium]|nr:DUF169 domain-containing protein [Acidobacteriota bacterium]